jgi:hypothetical protein
MKASKFYLIISALSISVLLLGACGPGDIVNLAAAGNCPPGYHSVYGEQAGSPGTCQPDTNPLVTVTVPANGICPPGYHIVHVYLEFPQFDYCELDPTPTPPYQAPNPNLPNLKPTPTPTLPYQASSSGIPDLKPVLATVTVPANGICPPGYHKVSPAGYEFPELDYCELDPTPTPPYQAPNPDLPNTKPAIEVAQYCANKGANWGGVNISFPLDSTLHVDDWFSESPSHVKCVDDLSNPRSCWGPQSESFDILLCNGELGQNQNSVCETLPVTLGACVQRSAGESDNQQDPILPVCERDCR